MTGNTIAYGDVRGVFLCSGKVIFASGGLNGTKIHHIHPPAFRQTASEMAIAPRPGRTTQLSIRIGPTFENGTPVRTVPAAFPLTSVAFTPDLGAYFAPLAIGESRIGLFDTDTAELIREFSTKGYPRDIHMVGSSHLVVTYTGGVTIYEVETLDA